MKLKKLLKNFDPITKVKVWIDDGTEDEESKPDFDGWLMDIPWYLIEYYLDTNKDKDYEALTLRIEKNDRDVNFPVLYICLKEDK